MRVFVEDLNGSTITVECDRYDTVDTVKSFVGEQLATSCFSLSTGLSYLSPEALLVDCGVADETTLYVNCELLGGGKKRKKKTYTTPKKIKHKKKKVKLAVLKYYKVDGNLQISRLRKECPSETCGAGVFMAKHENRSYCGRCGATYFLKGAKEDDSK